ncbi:hypothetical protein LTR53_001004 [Teratosphaeriaceae sp. CCFEE 6253]|nr:hypothetical protein LTR53_001004 [Teratosphaeriaceae sp. CCFEE 6253]
MTTIVSGAEAMTGECSEQELRATAKLLLTKEHIVVLVGAGISAAAGIRPFRGLQSLSAHHTRMFQASTMNTDTDGFADYMNDLRSQCRNASPTLFHHMLSQLQEREQLKWLFTQNIDGLEGRLRALSPITTHLHGCLDSLFCLRDASHRFAFDEPHHIYDTCPQCESEQARRPSTSNGYDEDGRRRSSRLSQLAGRLRPDIVLYGEATPDEDSKACQLRQVRNVPKPDALIIAGTSLAVPKAPLVVETLVGGLRSDGEVFWINPQAPPSYLLRLVTADVRASADHFAQAVMQLMQGGS